MIFKSNKILISLVLLIFSFSAFSQEEYKPFQIMLFERPSENEGYSNLSIYIKEYYKNLEFFREDTLFASNYEFSVELYDKDVKLVKEEYWIEKIQVGKYPKTKSDTEFISKYIMFKLEPGTYDFILEAKNSNSGRFTQKRQKITVKSYWDKEFIFSDIVCYEGRDIFGKNFNFFSNLKEIIADYNKGITFFSEIFIKNVSDERTVTWCLSPLYRSDTILKQGNQVFSGKENKIGELKIHFSAGDINSGKYMLTIKTDNFKDEKIIGLMWKNFPAESIFTPQAVEYMKYILEGDQKEELTSLKGDKQKEKFLKYWSESEPSGNESYGLMKEYFFRINYANMKFTNSIRAGWETDMGRIFVLIGKPDNITTEGRVSIGDKYEIWDYTSISRRYIFVDRYNNGDFKLVRIVTPQGEIKF